MLSTNDLGCLLKCYGEAINAKAKSSWLKSEEIQCLLVMLQAFPKDDLKRLDIKTLKEGQIPVLELGDGVLFYTGRRDRWTDGIIWKKKTDSTAKDGKHSNAIQLTYQEIKINNVQITGVYTKSEQADSYQRR